MIIPYPHIHNCHVPCTRFTVFGIDVNGNVNEWNFKTAEITGYSREEAFNKPLVANFIAKGFRESVQEVLDKALTGVETANYELEFHTKSKETRFLLVNASTRRDIENNIVGGKWKIIGNGWMTVWVLLLTSIYHIYWMTSCIVFVVVGVAQDVTEATKHDRAVASAAAVSTLHHIHHWSFVIGLQSEKFVTYHRSAEVHVSNLPFFVYFW
jgi:PAS domain S-box-containing protein